MILKGTYNLAAFVRRVSDVVCDGTHSPLPDENQNDLCGGDLVYIGGGYWRLMMVRDEETDRVIGGRLINPDRNGAEIAIVEKAVAIIQRMEVR